MIIYLRCAKNFNVGLLSFQGWCWNLWNWGTNHEAVQTTGQTRLQEMLISLVSRCHAVTKPKSDGVYDCKNSMKTVQTKRLLYRHILSLHPIKMHNQSSNFAGFVKMIYESF